MRPRFYGQSVPTVIVRNSSDRFYKQQQALLEKRHVFYGVNKEYPHKIQESVNKLIQKIKNNDTESVISTLRREYAKDMITDIFPGISCKLYLGCNSYMELHDVDAVLIKDPEDPYALKFKQNEWSIAHIKDGMPTLFTIRCECSPLR